MASLLFEGEAMPLMDKYEEIGLIKVTENKLSYLEVFHLSVLNC